MSQKASQIGSDVSDANLQAILRQADDDADFEPINVSHMSRRPARKSIRQSTVPQIGASFRQTKTPETSMSTPPPTSETEQLAAPEQPQVAPPVQIPEPAARVLTEEERQLQEILSMIDDDDDEIVGGGSGITLPASTSPITTPRPSTTQSDKPSSPSTTSGTIVASVDVSQMVKKLTTPQPTEVGKARSSVEPFRSVMKNIDVTTLSTELRSKSTRSSVGLPTSIAVRTKLIAVGTTYGLVLLFDHFQSLKMILGSNAQGAEADHGAVTCVDLSPDCTIVVAGFDKGHVVVWDVAAVTGGTPTSSSSRKPPAITPISVLTNIHNAPVHGVTLIHTGEKCRFLSTDVAGSVNLVTITKFLFKFNTDITPIPISTTNANANNQPGQPTPTAGGGISNRIFSGAVLDHWIHVPQMMGGGGGHVMMPQVAYTLAAFAFQSQVAVMCISPALIPVAQIPRPTNVAESTLPYVAWRRSSPSEPGQRQPEPALAVGWGNQISIFQIFNEQQAEGLSPISSGGPLSFGIAPIANLMLEFSVAGIYWLAEQIVGVIERGEKFHIIDPLGMSRMETLDIKPIGLVYHSRFGSPAYHSSVSITNDGTFYLLGLNAVDAFRILQWNERIQSLLDADRWTEGINLALDFFSGRAKAVIGLPRDADRLRTQVGDRISQLLLAYVDRNLALINGQTDEGFFIKLGTACIEYCLKIQRQSLLFDSILVRFQSLIPSRGPLLLSLLPSFIESGQVPNIPANVLHLLIEHFQAANDFKSLENCMLHMTFTRDDVEGVMRLCKRHKLYRALVYLYNSMNEYVPPLEQLLTVMATDEHSRRQAGDTVLLYLKACMLGLTFASVASLPNAAALDPKILSPSAKNPKDLPTIQPQPILPVVRLTTVKHSLLCYLFDKTPKEGGVVGSGAESSGGSGLASPMMISAREAVIRSLGASSARLQTLLKFNSKDMFTIFEIVFDDCGQTTPWGQIAVAQSPTPPPPAAETFQPPASPVSVQPALPLAPSSPLSSTDLLKSKFSNTFKRRADPLPQQTPPQTPTPPISAPASPRSAALTPTPTQTPLPVVQLDREDIASILISVMPDLNSTDVYALVDAATKRTWPKLPDYFSLYAFLARHFARSAVQPSMEVVYKMFAYLSMDPTRITATIQGQLSHIVSKLPDAIIDYSKLLLCAQRGTMHAVAVFLHTKQGNYAKVLECFLADAELKSQVFDYIRKTMNDTNLVVTVHEKMKAAVISHLSELVGINSAATSRLIIENFATEHNTVTQKLEAYPELLFQYLKGIMGLDESAQGSGSRRQRAGTTMAYMDEYESRPAKRGNSDMVTMDELRERAGIVLDENAYEKYIELLCRYEPQNVYAYLSNNETYRLDVCLRFCEKYTIMDARAYLLERTGDASGALDLMLKNVEEKVKTFEGVTKKFPQDTLDSNEEIRNAGKAVEASFAVAVSLCQRSSQKDDTEAQELWFRLLDVFMTRIKPPKSSVGGVGAKDSGSNSAAQEELVASLIAEMKKIFSEMEERKQDIQDWQDTAQDLEEQIAEGGDGEPLDKLKKKLDAAKAKVQRYNKELDDLQNAHKKKKREILDAKNPPKVEKTTPVKPAAPQPAPIVEISTFQTALNAHVRTILSTMISHVPLPEILKKILKDHGNDPYAHFKEVITGMLENFAYERMLLETANKLIHDDAFRRTAELTRKIERALAPKQDICGLCQSSLRTMSKEVSVFNCGHAFHLDCLGDPCCPECTTKANQGGRRQRQRSESAARDTEDSSSPRQPAGSNKNAAEAKVTAQYLARYEKLSRVIQANKSELPVLPENATFGDEDLDGDGSLSGPSLPPPKATLCLAPPTTTNMVAPDKRKPRAPPGSMSVRPKNRGELECSLEDLL